jgi:hypothetical protein
MGCLLKCTKKYKNAVILAKDESVEQIKREIKNVSNFKFVKTLDEFKENINPNSFLAISTSITEYSPVANLIKQFPNCVFHWIFEPPDTWPLKDYAEIKKEKNVDKRSYFIPELIDYLKEVVQLVH